MPGSQENTLPVSNGKDEIPLSKKEGSMQAMNERADFLTEGGRLFPSSIILGSFQDRSGVLVDGTEVSIRFNSRAYIYPVGGGLPDGLSRIFRDEPSCQKIRPPYLSGQLPVKHAHSMDAGSQERPAACGAWLIFTPGPLSSPLSCTGRRRPGSCALPPSCLRRQLPGRRWWKY